MMTTYLNALAAQDPSKASLAPNVRFTEDSKDLKVGDGFWKTATKVGEYRQDIIDVKEQVIATHVVMEAGTGLALFTARLKVNDGKITEVETLVAPRNGGLGNFNIRPDMGVEPPAAQKNKREDLIRIADYYPRGLTIGGFDKVDAPFATDAFRIENGGVMAGPGCGRGGAGKGKAPAPPPATGAAPAPAAGRGAVNSKAPQDVAGCANIKTQGIITHPDLTKSLVAVDEEQGITLIWMNFGDTGSYGAGNALVIFEAFKIYGGQMHAVQAFMKTMPKDTQRGWGKTQKGME
jgi:hypothetical protein